MDDSAFVHLYDARIAAAGPPCVFLRTIEGVWRVQADLSRDCWVRLDREPARDPAHGLMRDRETGYVTPIYATARALMDDHPRVEVVWYPSEEAANAAYDALGRPPLMAAADE